METIRDDVDIQIGRSTFNLLLEKGITRYRRKGFGFNALAISDEINLVGIATIGKHRALVIPKYLTEMLKTNNEVTTADKRHRFKFTIVDQWEP